jgi:hypothetical protein
MVMPASVLETRSAKRFVGHVGIRGHGQVDVEGGPRVPRVELHRNTADQRVRHALSLEEGGDEMQRRFLGIPIR